MADNTITFKLEALAKDALDSFNKFSDSASKDISKVQKNLDGFKKIALGVGAAIAAGFAAIQIKDLFVDGIKAASDLENSVQKLSTQLRLSGQFTQEAVDDFVEYASALERATNVGDDLILQQLAVAKAYGLSNEQSKELISAATELSAITGDDLVTSTDQLLKSLSGQGRALAAVSSEFAGLTKEQFKNGEAIRVLNEQYGGTAAQNIQTFSGQLEAAQRSFTDIFKGIGGVIIRSPELIQTLSSIAAGFQAVQDTATENGDAIADALGNTIRAVVKFGDLFIQVFAKIEQIFTGAVAIIINDLAKLVDGFAKASKLISGRSGLTRSLEDVSDSLKVIGTGFERAATEGNTTFGNLAKVADSFTKGFEKSEKKVKNFGDVIADQTKKNVAAFQSAADSRVEIEAKANEEILKKAEDAAKAQDKILQDRLKDNASLIANFATSALDGQKGAVSVVSQGAGAVADFFVPGLGAAVAPLIGKLAEMTPEQIKEQVTAFAENIPIIIEALAENIPALVEVLIDVFITKGGGIKIGTAIVSGMAGAVFKLFTDIFSTIAKALDAVFSKIFTGLKDFLDKFVPKIFEGVGAVVQFISTAIADAFTGVFEGVTSVFKGIIDFISDLIESVKSFINAPGETISNIGSSIAGIFGFAEGGLVPDGFPNDTFPARLSSNELVIDRSLTGKLENFLDGGGADTNTALLAQILNKLSQPVTVESSVNVNQKAFADIILQLSRNNARLAV